MEGASVASGRRLAEALRDPACYDHACDTVELIETHLSWVLLTGPYAYKLKKPVNLGFADFGTLERRKAFCELELELNRRLAPQLYRDVVAITGTAAAPRIGGNGPVLEYAVRMVEFPQPLLAARQLQAGRLEARHLEALARDVAAFHLARLGAAPPPGLGTADATHAAAQENFRVLRELPGQAAGRVRLEALATWSAARFAAIAPVLRRRREEGYVRECHGDLHLGNLALLDGRLVPFDCIEFNPALRWIDTACEIAFTVMDLHRRGAPALAQRFLNAWLEATGDYEALDVLDYFLVYRALVRAKVAAIRAAQHAPGTPGHAAARAEARDAVALARTFMAPRHPRIVVMHGLSGSGKSVLSQALADALGLVRLRSDVERKRLFGLPADARTRSGLARGLYAGDVTARTYRALERRAARIVRSGYGVVVDATFLRRKQREAFADLARRLGCRFRIVACRAPAEVLRERIAARRGDASEATPAVLAAQAAAGEPPGADEAARTFEVDTSRGDAAARLAALMQINAAPVRRPMLKDRPPLRSPP